MRVVLLSIPGLRAQDLDRMPRLRQQMAAGEQATLTASFPAVTWPVQANMLTGTTPNRHGVVANGFYWREEQQVEMWTASNDKVMAPQLWDRLHAASPDLTSAVWFPMLSKGCGADYLCVPAPIHHADGSESLWCATRPADLYETLRDRLGHFPLQHFWGPLANRKSSAWIVDSALFAAAQLQPHFFYIYLPHLDYAAQRDGPESRAAHEACRELDLELERLFAGCSRLDPGESWVWLAASEYAIVPVDHVAYPNRQLRQAGLLAVHDSDRGEQLDVGASSAWTLVDHQAAHVFVQRGSDVGAVVDLFRNTDGIEEILVGEQRASYGLDHPRAGEVVLISAPRSWMAYYWWLDDARAPDFARTVDIHRKPGYDPVELHWDATSRSIPLDAALVRGSHGAPVRTPPQQGVLLSSQQGVLRGPALIDRDVFEVVLRLFAIDA